MGYRYRSGSCSAEATTGARPLRLALLGRVGLGKRTPLRDQSLGDPGLFGPGSYTWQVIGDPLTNISTSIFQQIGPPPIAQALLDNGGISNLPARVAATQMWLDTVVFGTVREARRACMGMLYGHRNLGFGTIPVGSGTGAFPDGTIFEVADPLYLAWVLGSIIDHAATAYKSFRGPLCFNEEAAYVREWHIVLRLLEIPPTMWWRDHRHLRAFLYSGLRSWAAPGPGARSIAKYILAGNFSNPFSRFAWRTLFAPTIELADVVVCDFYGLRLSALERMTLRGIVLILRLLGSCGLLPLSKKVKEDAAARVHGICSAGGKQ